MKNVFTIKYHDLVFDCRYLFIAMIWMWNLPSHLQAQCVTSPGVVEGIVFKDSDNDGLRDGNEWGLSGVVVTAVGQNGALLGTSVSDDDGIFQFDGLKDEDRIRLTFHASLDYYPGVMGVNNGSHVQQVTVPSCDILYGLSSDYDLCHEGTEILTTCFVQGSTTENTMEPTIVGIEYGFTSSTPGRKFAAHGETGSIWGIAWKSSTKEVFSASFIKQHSGLRSGHDAIFVTRPQGNMHATQKFVSLSDLGIDVSDLEVTNPRDCAYGSQVGKKGLGAMVLSPDEKYLYVVDIENHQLVRINTNSPQPSNTRVYSIPASVNESYPFALKYYNDAIYIGVTEPGSRGIIYRLYPEEGDIEEVGLNIPVGQPWVDQPVVGGEPSLWLTDIDFTDEGHMLISLTDRIGHIYCNEFSSRLDEQKGDLFIAFKTNTGWNLEDRSGGQIFFSEAYWVTNPSYHSKITTGSIFSMPGTKSVVSTVFDPETNSYSGGLHRYSTVNGSKIGSKELYSLQTTILFGKAVGFGDIIAACESPKLEIGNLVWTDVNGNGLQDAGEDGMSDVPLVIMDTDCRVIGRTTTDNRGYYAFNSSNVSLGINAFDTYFISLDPEVFNEETKKYLLNSQFYLPASINNSSDNHNSKWSDSACEMTVVTASLQQTSHNFDIGMTLSDECDLKITKRIDYDERLNAENGVQMEITIHNQGSQFISSVDIQQSLNPIYSFDPSKNAGWVKDNGTLSKTLEVSLASGESVSMLLVLDMNVLSESVDYLTETSIVSARDFFGNELNISSCFDPSENQTAQVIPEVCDLALMHRAVTSLITFPNRNIEFRTTICNQGTVDADIFQIVNYLNSELDFNPAINEGWSISQDLTQLTFTEAKGLKVGACRDISLFVTLKEDAVISQLVNIAEISMGQCSGMTESTYDFDSTFDTNPENDRGGHPNTETDDMMDDKGSVDEDDHDPAVVRIQFIDLSINKYVQNRNVHKGEEVVFYFDIKNVGREPVTKFVLVNDITEYLEADDALWIVENHMASRELFFQGGFHPGETVTVTLNCHVLDTAPEPATIINRVRIDQIYDINLVDIKNPDKGNINELPEYSELFVDDEDFTVVVINRLPEVGLCSVCRPGTTSENGQFLANISLASAEEEDWYVESAIGLFDVDSGWPPAIPIELQNVSDTDTLFLDESPISGMNGHSNYILNAFHIDNQGFYLVLRNKFGAIEIVDVPASTCSFEHMDIIGPTSLCTGSEAIYTVNLPEIEMMTYKWSVCNIYGECQTLPETGPQLNLDWGNIGNGVYFVKAQAQMGCYDPAELRVAVGSADEGSIACIGDFQVSLDGNCEMMVTPQMLVAGSFNTSSPYTIMLTDMQGNIIPNATLTSIHVGTIVLAKLTEGCGGNSCWSNIRVEDKVPPVSLCQPDITIPCMFLTDYTGPFESDNCDGPVINSIVNEETISVCEGNVIKYIDRIYQATDARGNKSGFCSMRITVTRPDFSREAGFLKFPDDLTMDNALLCSEFEMDAQGRPHPEVSGVPTYAGRNIFPVVDVGCNTSVWYTDEVINIGCITKVFRTWHIYEQCSSEYEYISHTQTIEITDNKNPYVTPYSNASISTSGENCVGLYTIQLPEVQDTCSPSFVVDVTYPGGVILNMRQSTTIALPQSDIPHLISVKVTDACGNYTVVSFTVLVSDITSPVTVCKGELVVGLSSLGEAFVKASSYDDGSYDDCTITKMLVRRMDEQPCGECDAPSIDGFRYLGSFTNAGKEKPHYYYLSRHQLHAKAAYKMAEAIGGYMVSLNNAQEAQWLHQEVQTWIPENDYLIGLSDVNLKNEFKWASAESLLYTNWVAGQPVSQPFVKVNNSNARWSSFYDNASYWYVVEITDPCGFADDISFCCDDVSDQMTGELRPQTVVFRAIDKAGNWNECMVNTIVQDKHKPEIICPQNVEIDCGDVFSGMDLTQYGEALPLDGCGADVRELDPVFDLDACRVGEITRFFEASDGTNTAVCSQTISVGNTSRFNPSIDIQWPDDHTVINVCGMQDLSPDNLPAGVDRPILTQSACGMAAASHKDRVFEFITDACFKIVRTWTVIDWCEMERLGSDYQPATYTQTIKVLNDIAPEIQTDIIQDTVFFTEKGNCIDGEVALSVTANDVCTPDNRLRWKVRIDTIRTGVFHIERSGFGPIAYINEILPVGNHLIQWIFEDRCGNVTTRDQNIFVRNNDKPVANGLECITVAITPWDTDGNGSPDIEKGCIQAYTLNASSYSVCCEEDLRFSFSEDINDTERCFDCADVGDEIFVELWVHDCNGLTDFVRVCVIVQDNNDSNVCEEICNINPVEAEVSGELFICPESQTTLTASGGESYLWSTGATTPSITVTPMMNTLYSVTVTDKFNCFDVATVEVAVIPLPEGEISGDNVCLGEIRVLTALGGSSYVWSTGQTTPSISVSPDVNTTYTVTVTNDTGCSSEVSRLIEVYPLPEVNITGNNQICLNDQTTLIASSASSYIWSTGATTASITVSPESTTIYSVTATDSNGCVATEEYLVNVLGISNVAVIDVQAANICIGENTILSAVLQGGIPSSYLWSTGATTPSITVTPSSNTTYSVTITDTNGCRAQDNALITVNPQPVATITGDNICEGETASLTASGGVSYLWNTGATTATINVSPSTSTTYRVTVTSSFGCTSAVNRLLQVFPLPNAQISPANVNICLNDAAELTASGGVSYIWNTGETTATINVSPTTNTTYTVTVTSANDCVASSSRTVIVSGVGAFASITGTLSVCSGESSTLTANLSGGVPLSYLWSTGATTPSITVTPSSNTTYSVTITDTNGCRAQDNALITVNPQPVATITGDNICEGETASLTASGGVSYLWNTGATTATINVSPSTSTTYRVTVTSSFGCTSAVNRLLQVFPLPNAQISPANVNICLNDAAELTASGGVSYIWNTGETTATINVSPTTNTTYTVTVTSANDCVASSSRTVIVSGVGAFASITGLSPVCLGESSTLTANLSGGVPLSYLWSTGETTQSINVTPSGNTTYSVTITDTNGCNASTSFTVDVNDLPEINIDGEDVCPGESATLTASGGVSYVWSTGATTVSIVVTPTVSTTYTVTATDANGCSNNDQFTVDILPIPIVNISGENFICEGETTTLTASGGISYVWSTGETESSIDVNPDLTNTYIVTVTGNNTCTNSAEIEVIVNPNPEPVITGDLMICVGDTAFLTVSPGVSFLWSTGDVTPNIEVSPLVDTTYSVTVTDANGCTGFTSATILVDEGDIVCETQNIDVYLTQNGMVEIGVEDISTGTLGVCADVTASLDRTFFACNDVATSPITVTLTVTNNNTNISLTCTAEVTVLDTLPPTIICPANQTINCQDFNPDAPLFIYGAPIVSDNCPLGLTTSEVPVIDLGICNDGLITRTFTVTDGSGNSSQCVQSITIVNPVPFSEDAITWPSDVTISNCDDISLDSLGTVTIDDSLYDCAVLSISNSDDFPNGTLCGGAFSRVFVVTDACTDSTYMFTQNITVNVEQPQILGSTDTISIFRDTMTCTAEFEGSANFSSLGCNLTLTANITLPDGTTVTMTNWDLDGEYEDGFTEIQLIATESCDDLADTLNFVIEVTPVETSISCAKTYPEITDALIVEESVYEHVEIVQGCDVMNTIVASYSNTDINDTIRTYGCGDLPLAPIGLTVYFWEQGASAPFTLCQSLVGISDPNGWCISIGHRVSGNVHTEDMIFVPEVDIDLVGSGLQPIKTNITGNYAYPAMDGGGEYMVKPQKVHLPLEGVTTLDLILIQKHILGERVLPSPYKMIAADINRDNRIAASDLVELRKLILGIYDKFPTNTSWRMVDEAFVFPDPENPFISRFAEEYHIENLNSSMIINWIGVKTGDVNSSYRPDAHDTDTDSRSAGLEFTLPLSKVTKGYNSVPVKASYDTEIHGFQISLPVSGAVDIKVVSGLLDIRDDQYAYRDGILHISWNESEVVSISKDDVLFTLEWNMDTEDIMENVLLVQEKAGLNAEWYTENLDARSLSWRITGEKTSSFELLGNVPNPWRNETAIQFYLPEGGEVYLNIRDIAGRIVYQTKDYFQNGNNSFRVSNDVLDVGGLLIYDITYKNEVKTNKMLNIK